MAIIGRKKKQPNEVINYEITFADWLAERPGYSISSYTVTADAGIDVVTHRRSGSVIVVVLGGGTTGTKYKVTVTVTCTPDGLKKEAEFYVSVKEV